MATKTGDGEMSIVDQKVHEAQLRQSGLMSFVDNNKGDTANVFCSWIVFIVYGLVLTYIPYGYGDDNDAKRESDICPQQYNG
eukprot:g1337.t1